MITKTLVCKICGKGWKGISEKCEAAHDYKHDLINLADNSKTKSKDTLVCRVCAKEWGGESHCELSSNKKHDFVKTHVSY